MGFHAKLRKAWETSQSMLCVGLDPDSSRFPTSLGADGHSIFRFCRQIVDATADTVCAFKPQVAYFAAQGAEAQLERLCHYIRDTYPGVVLVLDAKRGDIGPTAEQYAREAFNRYGADVVTVNPYLGTDSIEPFLRDPRHGAFVLCRTSNRGGDDFQSLMIDGEPLYSLVARRAAEEWSSLGECGLVVGATYPQELARVRAIVGEMPLLVPGVGAQGGDVQATVTAGRTDDGYGMVINSSRAILYASDADDFAEAARRVAIETRDAIRSGAAAPSA